MNGRWRPAALLLLIVGLALPACSSSGDPDGAPDSASDTPSASDTAPDSATDSAPDSDTASDSASAPDSATDSAPDSAPDANSLVLPWQPPDDKLRVSVASGDLFAPLGVSTAGYGQQLKGTEPKSPFAKVFRATTTVLHPPGIRVIHLLRGERRILIAQTDLIGLYFLLRVRIADLVLERTGLDISDSLVIMANHTHSGPGHLINFAIGGVLADRFDEIYFNRVMSSAANVIIAALTAEAVPARVGWTTTENGAMHGDRRCENPAYTNDTMGIIRFDRADGGGAIAAILNYAMHGTVFSPKDGMLSGDAPRAVELKVREALPGAPLVMFVQSWAGDMSPGNPVAELATDGFPASDPDDYDRLEALGRSAADTVLKVWDDIPMLDDPPIDILSGDIPLSYELLGYTAEVFKYTFGGAYCGGVGDYCPGTGKKPKMDVCVPVPEELTLTQTRLTAFRIGDLAVVTLPGEPLTTLGEYLLQEVRARTGATTALLFGYAQDYTGYLLRVDDWYLGGYEAASNLWGPRQGEYLADGSASLATTLFKPEIPLGFSPAPTQTYYAGEGVPYHPTPSASRGVVVTDLAAQATTGDVLVFAWTGGDPYVDFPEVVVQVEKSGEGFVDFAPGGERVDQRHYRMTLGLDIDPAWDAAPADGTGSRTFTWRARLRTALRIPGPGQAMEGRFRIRVRGFAVTEAGDARPYEATSSTTSLKLAATGANP